MRRSPSQKQIERFRIALVNEIDSQIGLVVRFKARAMNWLGRIAKIYRIKVTAAAVESRPIVEPVPPRTRRNETWIVGAIQAPLADIARPVSGALHLLPDGRLIDRQPDIIARDPAGMRETPGDQGGAGGSRGRI